MTSIDSSIQAFRTTPEFQALADKQREYVLAYIECEQDRRVAAQKVFPDAKDPIANGYQVHRLPKVQRAIKLYYNVSDSQLDKDSFLILLSNSIREGGKDQLKAMQLYAEMKGWLDNPDPEEKEPEDTKDYAKELQDYEQGKCSSIGRN